MSDFELSVRDMTCDKLLCAQKGKMRPWSVFKYEYYITVKLLLLLICITSELCIYQKILITLYLSIMNYYELL